MKGYINNNLSLFHTKQYLLIVLFVFQEKMHQIILQSIIEPAHEKHGFPVCGSSHAHAQSLFGLQIFDVCLYYMSANSKGFRENVLMRRLARAFDGRLCDKYPFLMYWL